MPRKGGRPVTKGDEESGSRLIRVFADVAKMVSWVTRVTGESSAQYLDPIIRHQVILDFSKHYPAILAIKQAEDAARESTGQPVIDPLPVVLGVNAKRTKNEDADPQPRSGKKRKPKKT